MDRQRFRRRNFFIKKSFQSSFSSRFAILIVLEAVLMVVLFSYLSRGTLTTGYQGAEFTIEKTARFFFATFAIVASITAVAIALVGMAIFIVLSHRIAGPAHRLQNSLREIGSGNLTYRVRLRKKDELAELAEELNRLTESLDGKVGELKKEIARVSSGIPDKESLARLKQIADSFKTSR